MVPSLPSGPEVRRRWKDADGLAKRSRLINPSDLAGSAKKIPENNTRIERSKHPSLQVAKLSLSQEPNPDSVNQCHKVFDLLKVAIVEQRLCFSIKQVVVVLPKNPIGERFSNTFA